MAEDSGRADQYPQMGWLSWRLSKLRNKRKEFLLYLSGKRKYSMSFNTQDFIQSSKDLTKSFRIVASAKGLLLPEYTISTSDAGADGGFSSLNTMV